MGHFARRPARFRPKLSALSPSRAVRVNGCCERPIAHNLPPFADRIQRALPKTDPSGPLVWLKEPLVWLKDATAPAPMFSRYFATQDGVVMAATLEIPFAPPGNATDPASCRRYGRTILQAFVRTLFVSEPPKR